MECPRCEASNGTARGRQVVALRQRYDAGNLRLETTDATGQRLGRWDWRCDDCGHAWTRVANTQAQWIGEAAAQAQDAYDHGDHETMQVCLEAITAYAQDLGYVPDREADTTRAELP